MATKELYEQVATVLQAWLERRPDKKFFRMSVRDFADIVSPTFTTRAELANLEWLTCDARARRDEADRVTRQALQRVVNAVKGDPEEGEDGELYAAMGYKPRRLRVINCTGHKSAANAARDEQEVVEDED